MDLSNNDEGDAVAISACDDPADTAEPRPVLLNRVPVSGKQYLCRHVDPVCSKTIRTVHEIWSLDSNTNTSGCNIIIRRCDPCHCQLTPSVCRCRERDQLPDRHIHGGLHHAHLPGQGGAVGAPGGRARTAGCGGPPQCDGGDTAGSHARSHGSTGQPPALASNKRHAAPPCRMGRVRADHRLRAPTQPASHGVVSRPPCLCCHVVGAHQPTPNGRSRPHGTGMHQRTNILQKAVILSVLIISSRLYTIDVL
jgi:hypothetical protein